VSVGGANCLGTLYAPFGWRASGRGSSVTLAWEVPTLGCPPTEYIIEVGSTPGATEHSDDLCHMALRYNASWQEEA
jgi:hypothetical protein